jgi:hypothetical protein
VLALRATARAITMLSRNAALGRAGEAAAGIAKNTKRIESATQTAKFRVPDGLTDKVLTEVKNVGRLNLTNQIRDFAAYADANGLGFDLVVRKTTEFTAPMLDFIKAYKITVRYLPW